MPAAQNNASMLAWLFVVPIYAVTLPFQIHAHFAFRRHMRRLASEREGEDIGTFARAFDRHSEPFDPWVVRATWDALDVYVAFDGRHLPLRPGDRLVEDLCIDPDDICFELISEVAERSGHSMENVKSNPYCGRINTVGDFVRFITLQPRVEEGSCDLTVM
jgi:hypothetical protein